MCSNTGTGRIGKDMSDIIAQTDAIKIRQKNAETIKKIESGETTTEEAIKSGELNTGGTAGSIRSAIGESISDTIGKISEEDITNAMIEQGPTPTVLDAKTSGFALSARRRKLIDSFKYGLSSQLNQQSTSGIVGDTKMTLSKRGRVINPESYLSSNLVQGISKRSARSS